MKELTIIKVLTANDTGETGGHQAGILVPRRPEVLAFFPPLDSATLNPRVHLQFEDETDYEWTFAYIYYNNCLFGGTRNEYRLTRMTRYFKESGLASGDQIMMHRRPDGSYAVSHERANQLVTSRTNTGQTVLQFGSGWQIIDL